MKPIYLVFIFVGVFIFCAIQAMVAYGLVFHEDTIEVRYKDYIFTIGGVVPLNQLKTLRSDERTNMSFTIKKFWIIRITTVKRLK